MTDLRYAFRQLVKSPSFSATAIVALALGIGATTAMFAVIYAFLLRPLPYANPDQLVMLQSRNVTTGNDLGVNYLDFLDWRKESRSFSDVAFCNLFWNGNVESPAGSTETVKTTFTTANLFSLLGVQPMLGRDLTPADDEPNAPKVLLISERLWKRTFGGDPNIIGRDIRLSGTPRAVVGVMPTGFRFPSQTDLWVPVGSVYGMAWTSGATNSNKDRAWRSDQAIARLKPGVTMQTAQSEMSVIAERLAQQYPDTNKLVGAAVVPLRDHVAGNVRFSLLLLLAACGGVLLIACANVSQLLLARATTRHRELSVRAALGASRWRLARQALTESALLAIVGSIVGALLAVWLVDVVTKAIPIELPFWIRIDLNPFVLGFTILASGLTTLLAGSLPAFQSARVEIAQSMKSSAGPVVGAGARARELLTAAQVAISIVLLVGASLVLRSLLKLGEVNPGFDPSHVVMMTVNPTYQGEEPEQTMLDRYSRLMQRLSEMPGVESVAVNNSPPFVPQGPWNRSQVVGETQPVSPSLNPIANFQSVSPDYFRVLRIPLVRGRFFSAADKLGEPRVCIVSERLAKALWPNEDPVGRTLRSQWPGSTAPPNTLMTVVGVVGDVRDQALEREAGPGLYRPILQGVWKQLYFLVRARGNALALAPAIRREIASAAPEVGVYHFVSLEQEVANSLWQSRLRGWLLGFFSMVALALAATGLSGAIAYGVAQRTREIGVRMALGATRPAILRLVLGQGMRAVVLGLVAGIIGAIVVSRLLRASLFGISADDLASYTGATLLLAATAVVAALIPARRATQVNPTEALRTE
ncbi:MAG TPA: ABC transporter permease [Chthoniobacterales bacterium]|nr:ABC transporter permease [Chthoniobacterales bacterium]